MMSRAPSWAQHLRVWARGLDGAPFVWGQTDCHALVAEAYRIMYGGRLAGLPQWSSLRDAIALREHWLAPTALCQLGATVLPELPAARAMVGDVIMEPREPRGWHPLLIALGRDRFLTSSPADGRVWIAPSSSIHNNALVWRWANG